MSKSPLFARPLRRLAWPLLAVSLTAALSACARAPERANVPLSIAGVATICPVCPACTVCTPAKPDLTPLPNFPPERDDVAAPPEPLRGRLVRVAWNEVKQWGADDPSGALYAFLQGCPILKAEPIWAAVCAKAEATRQRPRGEIQRFFASEFEPYQALNLDGTESGTVTGYYEPLLRGSRTKTAKFRYPLSATPPDLLTIDMSEMYPDLKNRRLRGRIVGGRVLPYFERSEIDSASAPLKGLEIVWVDDPIEALFLQIQGSGQIQLTDGKMLRVGYADQNGHAFRSVAGALVRRGELKLARASLDGMKDWARRNPQKVQQFMNINPSYIFFKELAPDLTGPIGTLGVPLTAERSVAVDHRVIPLGVPVFLSTTYPGTKDALTRLMVAQDTGGAIAGGVRADFYWGFGDTAGATAGKMKQAGKMWVLLPRGYELNPK